MKRIYLVRHAQPVGKSADLADIDRTLDAQGMEDSRIVGRKLANVGIKPDLLISSPAKRALETARLLAQELAYAAENIVFRDTLYEADHGHVFVNLLRELTPDLQTVMVVGHAPTMSEFAQALVAEFDAAISKAGVVGIEFPDSDWADLPVPEGKVILLTGPTDKTD